MSSLSGSRKCHVVKKESEEFEFFLTADEDRHGQIITSVTKGGPANRAGLKDGDRILEINDVNVEKKEHGDIVAIIRECVPKNEIKFVVIDKENDPNSPKTVRPSRQSSKVEPLPRLCKIKKKNNSFGFFLERDSKGDFIKQVTKGGASDGTGLKQADRLIAVGKKNVEKLQHKQVVELIKTAGNKVSLLVIDEDGYDHCKTNNIPITEKMVRGSTSSRTSSSSSSKDKSVKSTSSAKSKKQSVKEIVSKINPHKGKLRVVHLLKHPSNGYGFYLRSLSNSSGEFIGKIDPDSSAELAGLFENDRVVAVNGKSIMDVNHADVITQIKSKQSQVVLIVLDQEAMKHLEENESFPGTDDIVLTYNPAIRTVKLKKGSEGYGMFLKVEKGRPSFHILTDVDENGAAGQAGLKNGEIIVAVNGSGVLKDNHADCVQKIKNAGETVELTVGSDGTCEFLSKADVEITADFIKEWPTEEEFQVPSFGKTATTVAAAAEAVEEIVEAMTTQGDEKLGMKPRLCRVVRGAKGYGFVLKEGEGHFLINIEDGSPAFEAGILEYDRIVEVNGENVDKMKHADLVSKIRASGNEVTFLVVNKEEDTFFKEKGIPITAALLDIEDELSDDHKPRLCKLERKPDGYGFHLTGEAGRPGQFIKEVQANSAAVEGGLRDGDKIIEVNGNSVIGETHDDIVKRITENKNEVTFLVIDKEGDTYYKLKGVKVVASMVVVKELIEEIAEEIRKDNEQDEDGRSIGEASATSSAIETEATVHKEPEIDENTLETIATVVAINQIADEVEEIRDEIEESTEVQREEEEEEKEERHEEILENAITVAAVAAVAVHAANELDDDSHRVDNEVNAEKPDAEEVAENIAEAVEDIKDQIEENLEEQQDDHDLSDVAKPLVAAVVVAHAVQDDDTESHKSSRPPTPQVEEAVLDEETKEAVKEIIEDHVEAPHEDEEHLKEIAVAAIVIANEISDKASDRGEESDKEEQKEEQDELKVAATLVHQEILGRSEEIEPTPEEPEVKPAAVVVAIKATTPPSSPIVERERPESPKEQPDAVPLAVVLTTNGDIPKLKPTSPPPQNFGPKIIWGQRNLKPITKQISIGAAAAIVTQPNNDDAKVDTGAVKMSTVAALKAELERRHRQQQAAVVRNTVQDELAELSKQSGAASKHAALFGGSVKKPPGAPKKNRWVGEGMTIKIIET